MMKFSRRFLVALLLLTGNADAQVLYRCVSDSGAVSWQATTCARGMRMMKSIEYTPDAASSTPAPQHVRMTTTNQSNAATRYRGSSRTRRPKPNACALARDQREATLQRVGLKRNYDLLSKLDADVRAVCR